MHSVKVVIPNTERSPSRRSPRTTDRACLIDKDIFEKTISTLINTRQTCCESSADDGTWQQTPPSDPARDEALEATYTTSDGAGKLPHDKRRDQWSRGQTENSGECGLEDSKNRKMA